MIYVPPIFFVSMTVSYAYENRVASIRIISPPLASPESTRIEVVRHSPYLLTLQIVLTLPRPNVASRKSPLLRTVQIPIYHLAFQPGADSSPHLVLLSLLSLGLYGIQNSLPLPFPPISTSSTEKTSVHERLAKNLGEATSRMKKSGLVRECLGDKFVEHFCETREREWEGWERAVTDWELGRYFELV
jgi:glutamine synthetase